MSNSPEIPSQHPVDNLIRRLIATGGPASASEIQAIIDRMATAPFNANVYRVQTRLRLTYDGETLGSWADSLSIHLVKRVLAEGQWAVGTTKADYLQDIQAVVRHPGSRVLVSQPEWGAPFAASIADTINVVPRSRRGPNALPQTFVVYSTGNAKIATAYMFSSLATLRLSGDTVWLR